MINKELINSIKSLNYRLSYIEKGKKGGYERDGKDVLDFIINKTKQGERLKEIVKEVNDILGKTPKSDYKLPTGIKTWEKIVKKTGDKELSKIINSINNLTTDKIFTIKEAQRNKKEYEEFSEKHKKEVGTEFTGSIHNIEHFKWKLFNEMKEKGYDSNDTVDMLGKREFNDEGELKDDMKLSDEQYHGLYDLFEKLDDEIPQDELLKLFKEFIKSKKKYIDFKDKLIEENRFGNLLF